MKGCVHPVLVGFGDCDPAGIVYYPNFFRWFDEATQALPIPDWFRAPFVDVDAANDSRPGD